MKNLILKCSMILSISCALLAAVPGIAMANSEFRMLGLALHQETGRDIYLGAIHMGRDAANPNDVLNSPALKSMEYRVVARRTSLRSLLGNMLLQSEVANGVSPPTPVVDFAGGLLSAVKGSLYAGDSLKLSQSESGAVVATLNETELLALKDTGIFDYLLKGWVGEGAPSSTFRSNILSTKLNEKLFSKYTATVPADERVAKVAQWVAGQEEEIVVASSTETLAVADQTEVVEVQVAQTADDSEVATPNLASEALSTSEVQPQSIELPLSSEEELVPVASPETLVAVVDTATEVQPDEAGFTTQLTFGTGSSEQSLAFQPVESAVFELPSGDLNGHFVDATAAVSLDATFQATEVWSFDNKTRIEPKSVPELVAQDSFDILSLDVTEYSHRLAGFNTEVMKMVYAHIKYPRRAVRRSLEGALELDVILQPDGTLVEVAIGQSSGYSILDGAAVEAAQKALVEATLGEIDPVAIAEYGVNGQLIIPVPVNFVLQ